MPTFASPEHSTPPHLRMVDCVGGVCARIEDFFFFRGTSPAQMPINSGVRVIVIEGNS